MSTVKILSNHGTLRPASVIDVSALAGLELAAAATLLAKESGGGRNIYGHDGVKTGGFYDKGGPVTKANFQKYREHRKKLGAQGVGPTQLTYIPFQDRADANGGCHDWRANALTGFGILSMLISQHGVHGGFRRYNGSGPAAEKYGDDAVARIRVWRMRLGSRPGRKPHIPHPTLEQGDTGALVTSLQVFMNKTFPLYSHIDLAPDRYGASTSKVIAEFQRRAGVSGKGVNAAGRSIGPPTWAALEFFGFH
jgi:hypothetical protein